MELVGVMNLIVILSCLFVIQGREPYLYDFVPKKIKQKILTFVCIQTATDWFLSNLVWW